jgi:hypothetical protein
MASTINADNGVVSGSSGVKTTADTSGVLALQSNGTTGLTLNTSLALGVGSGNSTGSSGQVLTSAGSSAPPTWSAVTAATYEEFASSGTWTKPSGATFVTVELWGAGGGGGSGRLSASGTDAFGGGGGGGGGYVSMTIPASTLSSTVAVTIGAGGSGGVAVSTSDTSGNAGTTGGSSTFGAYVTSYGGSGGNGGTTSSGTGGPGGGLLEANSTAPAYGQFNGAGALNNAAWGGAGGGDSRTAETAYAGGSSFQGGCAGGAGMGIVSSNNNIGAGGAGGDTPFGTNGTGGAFQQNGSSGSGRAGGGGGGIGSVLNYDMEGRGAYGNSTFLCATQDFLYLTSSDAITWTERIAPFFIDYVVFDGSKFVFITPTSEIYSTTNFTTYTQHASVATTGVVNNFRFQNNKYFVLGRSRNLFVSDDLITWTSLGASTGASTSLYFRDVFYDGSQYYFATSASTASTSSAVYLTTNLSSWSNTGGLGYGAIYRIGGGGGNIIVRCNTTPFGLYSPDSGVTWNQTNSLGSNGSTGDIAYIGSTYVTNSSSAVYTSTNASSWTLRTDPTTDNYGVILSSGSTYFMASTSATTTVGIYSTNFTSWTAATKSSLLGTAGSGGAGGVASGGGGGGANVNGNNSGAGAVGGNGLCRVYTW